MSVASLTADAITNANNMVDQASTAMGAAISMAGAIGYSLPVYASATLPTAPTSTIDVAPPALSDVTLNLPEAPNSNVTFQDISQFDAGKAPTFEDLAPDIQLPTSPSQVSAFTGTMPLISTSIVFPDPPSALLAPVIDAPTLSTYTTPDAPTVALPALTAVAPTNDAVVPTNLDTQLSTNFFGTNPKLVTMANGYVDDMLAKYNPQFAAQMSAIEAQLSKYLAGGTGLNAAAENAIYERAKGKNNAEALRVRDQALQDAAARGFTMPGGALLSAMQQARQGGADNNAKAAAEIVAMQAEMEQKNLQFAVTTSAGLRTSMVSAAMSYMQNVITISGQSLEYAKSVMNAVIQVYNIAVEGYKAKLEGYKADVAVYEAKIRGAMANIELYKAEIDALNALTNVDRAKVDIYRARIETLVSLSNVYKAQIDAVQGRVGLEKLKLEVFQAQVQTYATQVQAKNAEWQGYTAAVNGETAKVQMFEAKARAFAAQVSGYQATVQAKSEVVRAIATANQSKATQYSAMMDGYKSVVSALGAKASTQIENQRQYLVAYQAKIQAQIGQAQVAQTYYKATADVAIQNAESKLKAQIAGMESQRAYNQVVAQLGTANAQVFANLAGSAMAGMNTLAAETLIQ